MKNLILALGILISALSPAVSSTKVVFRGTPLVHVIITPDTVKQESVPKDKRDQFMVLITKDEQSDTYTWASREDYELYVVQSGAFSYFLAPSTGMVKVGDVGRIAEVIEMAKEFLAPPGNLWVGAGSLPEGHRGNRG